MGVALQLDRVADELFPDLKLGDVRRDRRFRHVVETIAHNPGVSLPCLFPNPSGYHADLDLFDTLGSPCGAAVPTPKTLSNTTIP